MVLWAKASYVVLDSGTAAVPASGDPFCIALDITGFPGDVIMVGVPKTAWDPIGDLPVLQRLEDWDVELKDTSVGFSLGSHLSGAPKTQFFSGERIFTYNTSGLNFWLNTQITKTFIEFGSKETLGLSAKMTVGGEAGLRVTNPFGAYDDLFKQGWEGYIDGSAAMSISFSLLNQKIGYDFTAKAAVLASLDGDTGTKLPDRDLCGDVQNPKGIFLYFQMDYASSGFGESYLKYVGSDFDLTKYIGVSMNGGVQPLYMYMLYNSKPQSDGTWNEGIAGFGFRFTAAESVCFFPGLCARVLMDMAVADIDVLGRCDNIEEVYRQFPEGTAISVRGIAQPKPLGGMMKFDSAEATVRMLIATRKLALLSHVKVTAVLFGFAVETNLAIGTYPRPFMRLNYQAKLFNTFMASLDVLALVPSFDSNNLLDWFFLDYTVTALMMGDITKALVDAVEAMLRSLGKSATDRIQAVEDVVLAIQEKVASLSKTIDDLLKGVEDARKFLADAKKVRRDGGNWERLFGGFST